MYRGGGGGGRDTNASVFNPNWCARLPKAIARHERNELHSRLSNENSSTGKKLSDQIKQTYSNKNETIISFVCPSHFLVRRIENDRYHATFNNPRTNYLIDPFADLSLFPFLEAKQNESLKYFGSGASPKSNAILYAFKR